MRRIARTVLFAAAVTAAAQSQPELQFDVASVRVAAPIVLRGPIDSGPGAPVQGGPGTSDPGRIAYRNLNLRTIVMFALGGGPSTSLPASRIVTPDWMTTANYDIEAKVPAGATKPQSDEMMLNLLKERLHLKFHHEMRPFDGYELTIPKTGLKIKESANPDAPQAPPGSYKNIDNDFPQVEPGYTFSSIRAYSGRMFWTARNQPMASLISTAMNSLGPGAGVQVQIADHTGLTAKYDWNIQFAGRPATPDADPPGGPSIVEAFEKQLGLHLEKKRVTLDVVVVDNADKIPTEN
jgi:uncharacterized protein (TIGR03435 family)